MFCYLNLWFCKFWIYFSKYYRPLRSWSELLNYKFKWMKMLIWERLPRWWLVVEPKLPDRNRRSAKGRNLHQLLSKYFQNNLKIISQQKNQEKIKTNIRNQETADFRDFGLSTLSPYFAVIEFLRAKPLFWSKNSLKSLISKRIPHCGLCKHQHNLKFKATLKLLKILSLNGKTSPPQAARYRWR